MEDRSRRLSVEPRLEPPHQHEDAATSHATSVQEAAEPVAASSHETVDTASSHESADSPPTHESADSATTREGGESQHHEWVPRRKSGAPRRRTKAWAALGDRYGPFSEAWSNSIALCTTMRDENVTDVREWVLYHKWLGVDHIFLTENHSVRPIQDGLQDFIDSGFLTYSTMDQPAAQMLVFQACYEQHRTDFNWMAFIDADEYLGVRENNLTLKQLLDEYKYFPGIAVHWLMFGSNNRTTRPEAGGNLRHYTRCGTAWETPQFSWIKTIANMFYMQSPGHNPHNMYFRGRAMPVNENRIPIPMRYGFDDTRCPHKAETPGCVVSPNHKIPNEYVSWNRFVLYHYVVKSDEDFQLKTQRGAGFGRPRPMTFHDGIQRHQGGDPICSDPSQLADKCCPLDKVQQVL